MVLSADAHCGRCAGDGAEMRDGYDYGRAQGAASSDMMGMPHLKASARFRCTDCVDYQVDCELSGSIELVQTLCQVSCCA